MITFSIVTITYHAARVVQPTLDSVLMQRHPDVEHLIIDGASQDDTLRLVEDYARRSEEMRNGHQVMICSEPDKGIYDAMNKGLARATGDYVCFLNAGDRLPEAGTLERIAAEAESLGDGRRPAVLYGDTDVVDEEGRFLFHRRLSPPDKLTWRSFRRGMLVCHQAFYARIDMARATPYDLRYRFSADVDWCIRVMKKAEADRAALHRVPGVVALYLREGQTTEHHRESLQERFDVMRRHYGLATTLLMHGWFVVRALIRKIKS